MQDRIVILKEIMEIEKQYALEEIDSESFEKRMQILEKKLHETNALTDEEFKQAVIAKEIPLSVDRLVGKISIEDLLPTFNVPRTFYRHLKIKREIGELDRNIMDLQHNIQKMKILLAEKKVNQEIAAIKIETLEFDLRLAENRYGAREKYLKRNPSKGDILQFTLKNYIKFSYGHGISDKTQLIQLASDLQEEVNLRIEYRRALAEMLATMKTTQLDISTSNRRNGLPDFKSLLEYQQMINELKDYIKILCTEITDYNSCIVRLQKEDNLRMDDSHELFVPEEFGIEIATEVQQALPESSQVDNIDPLLQSLSAEEQLTDTIGLFLIDISDASFIPEIPTDVSEVEIVDTFVIPETPLPTYEPEVDVEIVGGMEDFNSTFDVKGSGDTMNESTKQLIFKGFEGLLEGLIDKESVSEETATVVVKAKAKITPLSKELKKPSKRKTEAIVDDRIQRTDDDLAQLTDELIVIDEEIVSTETDMIESSEEQKQADTTLPPPPPPPLPAPPPIEEEQTPEIVIPDIPVSASTEIEEATELLPPPPPPTEEIEEPIIEEEIISEPEEIIAETETIPPPPPKKPEEDLIKPQKTRMISPKLLEASTEAWKLSGKEIFDFVEEKRDFLGYIQEVIVFDKNRLGFILVSEESGNQSIIDKIFDQIKPLWITEEYLESAAKRKEYVIREVMESLQVQNDVALHINKLQEFTNFRNINYPDAEKNTPPEIVGIVPVDKIRIKRGSIICSPENILELRPYRTAPWGGNLITEERTPIGKQCVLSKGQQVGKVISIITHPLLGKLLLIDIGVPDKSLVEYLVNRLDISEQDPKERLWLVKYLIAKQLRIPEGEALKPKTLINYSLNLGFPILPNEILNSYRVFISCGSIEKTTKKKVILRNVSRIFNPSEVFPLNCLRVRKTNGRHLGTVLGLSLSENPVMLVSERLSREIVMLFTNATLEKEVMNDISQSVMGSIGVDFKDSLCTHNILKSLIVGKKIQSLGEYGKYLSKMNVNGLNISDIQIVEKGTIYLRSDDVPTTNIFSE